MAADGSVIIDVRLDKKSAIADLNALVPSYEREQMANRVIGFYHRLPDEVERPFKRELLNEDARKKLPTMLADPEQAVELLEKMDAALLSVPLDSPEYAEKSKTLAELPR